MVDILLTFLNVFYCSLICDISIVYCRDKILDGGLGTFYLWIKDNARIKESLLGNVSTTLKDPCPNMNISNYDWIIYMIPEGRVKMYEKKE